MSSLVAIAVPVYRPRLTADEAVSWRHLEHYLGAFDTYLMLPEGLDSPQPQTAEARFPASYFSGTASYSRLLLSEEFYRRFERYEYLLVYQLDALVFDGGLSAWCEKGWDYLGAPWWLDTRAPERGFSHVGNGGLSLRRIPSFLRVLTRRPAAAGKGLGILRRALAAPDLCRRPWTTRCRKALTTYRLGRRGAGALAAAYTLNEDRFWSERAPALDASFTIPKPQQALPFAFEVLPRECWQRHGGRLPFGCHGWWRYDREFWAPHLLPTDS